MIYEVINMKKFLMTAILCLFMFSICHAETPTTVYDFDVYQFYKNYNNILKLAEIPEKFSIDKSRMITLPQSEGSGYLLPLKSYKKNKGTAIVITTDNKDNIIGIGIRNNKKNQRENLLMAFVTTVTIIDVTSDDLKPIMEELDPMSDGKTAARYIESIGKYIRVKCVGEDINKGVGMLVIDAYTE